MDKNQALGVLRGVQGLRDAFMGFNQVVDALKPVIEALAKSDETLEASQKIRDALVKEIAELDKKRISYIAAVEAELEKFNKIRQRVVDLANVLKTEA